MRFLRDKRVTPLEGFQRAFKAFSELALLLSLASLLPLANPLFEVNTNLGIYYGLGHSASLLTLILLPRFVRYKRQKTMLSYLFVLAVYQFSHVVPFFRGAKVAQAGAVSAQGASVKLFYANVFTHNPHKNLINEAITMHAPDIVALLEVNKSWREALALSSSFPHYREITREDNFGVALYSKYQFIDEPVTSMGEEGFGPVIITHLKLDDSRQVFFALIHCFPPVAGSALERNKLLLRRLASKIREESGPVILAGDLNATPFSDFYKRFTWGAELTNAMLGYGYRKTWQAQNPLVYFMLDHVLYRGGVVVKNVSVLPAVGSDHLPLLVEMVVL